MNPYNMNQNMNQKENQSRNQQSQPFGKKFFYKKKLIKIFNNTSFRLTKAKL